MIELQEQISLKEFNTFGLDVSAKRFASFSTVEELKSGINQLNGDPLLILGGGSNVLLTQDFDGLVLKNEIKGIEVIEEDNQHIKVSVGAGENWHQFVMHAIDNNWAGIENLSLIPGTVGAAPMQNIGAYGIEIKQVFDYLEALEISTGDLYTFYEEQCDFGYRESIFKKSRKGQFVITRVVFRLSKTAEFNISYGAIQDTLNEMEITELNIKAISDAVIKIRQSKLPDPAEIGNSGSFFKNPEVDAIDYERLKAEYPSIPGYKLADGKIKIPAAWLIEQDGWKGKTFDKIGVHKNQPLVLVNYGNGSGSDIRDLAYQIRSSIAKKFGIELTPEVNII